MDDQPRPGGYQEADHGTGENLLRLSFSFGTAP